MTTFLNLLNQINNHLIYIYAIIILVLLFIIIKLLKSLKSLAFNNLKINEHLNTTIIKTAKVKNAYAGINNNIGTLGKGLTIIALLKFIKHNKKENESLGKATYRTLKDSASLLHIIGF